jgi:hypothetical protein
MGGFARRMGYWNAFARKYPGVPLLRIDGGSAFASAMAEAPVLNRWILEGTWRSKLDAMNLSLDDVQVWRELSDLAAVGHLPREWLSVPLVSANVTPKLPGFPKVERFIIRNVPAGGGQLIRVGITGVLRDPDERLKRTEFEVREAAASAREAFAAMRDRTDYRVLLADVDLGRAISLAVAAPGFEVVVVAHNYAVLNDAQQIGESLLIVPINEGRMVNEVRVRMEGTSTQAEVQCRYVPLDENVPDDPSMKLLVGRAQAEVEIFKRSYGIR